MFEHFTPSHNHAHTNSTHFSLICLRSQVCKVFVRNGAFRRGTLRMGSKKIAACRSRRQNGGCSGLRSLVCLLFLFVCLTSLELRVICALLLGPVIKSGARSFQDASGWHCRHTMLHNRQCSPTSALMWHRSNVLHAVQSRTVPRITIVFFFW